ncbi:MAG: sigma-70 domain-containing protein, partial [Polyangiales bacterium]
LETEGRQVVVPTGATGIASLKLVLPATRRLATELGRKPTIDEIASVSGLAASDVRRALLLAQVIGRGR